MNKKTIIITFLIIMLTSVIAYADSSHTTMLNKASQLTQGEHFLLFKHTGTSGQIYMLNTSKSGDLFHLNSSGSLRRGIGLSPGTDSRYLWNGTDWVLDAGAFIFQDTSTGTHSYTHEPLYTNYDIQDTRDNSVFFYLTLAPATALVRGMMAGSSLMKLLVVGLVPSLILLVVASVGLAKALKFLVAQLRGV